MANKAKIIVGLACQRLVFARMCFSLVSALKDVDFKYDFVMSMSCDIVGARTHVVKKAFELKGTHVLFVDYDMFFAPKTIAKLLEADKDIIGAEYNYRKEPVKSTAIPKEGEDTSKPYKCEAIGAGLLLVKMSVFEKIAPPWFNFARDKEGLLIQGEDTWFCRKAIAEGFDVWASPNLDVKHIGEYEY